MFTLEIIGYSGCLFTKYQLKLNVDQVMQFRTAHCTCLLILCLTNDMPKNMIDYLIVLTKIIKQGAME